MVMHNKRYHQQRWVQTNYQQRKLVWGSGKGSLGICREQICLPSQQLPEYSWHPSELILWSSQYLPVFFQYYLPSIAHFLFHFSKGSQSWSIKTSVQENLGGARISNNSIFWENKDMNGCKLPSKCPENLSSKKNFSAVGTHFLIEFFPA